MGEPHRVGAVGVDHEDVVEVLAVLMVVDSGVGDAGPVGGPPRAGLPVVVIGDLLGIGAVGPHHEDVEAAVAVGHEGDARAVGRPRRVEVLIEVVGQQPCPCTRRIGCDDLGVLVHVADKRDPGLAGDRSVKERRHLGARHRPPGAVAGRLRSASLGDARGGQSVDRVGVGVRRADVLEAGARSGSQIEGARQEGRHLCPGHRLVRAVSRRLRRASFGDAQLGQAPHMGRPPLGRVDINEARVGRSGRIGLVEHADQPHGHRPAWQRVTGAQQTGGAFGASEDPLTRQ